MCLSKCVSIMALVAVTSMSATYAAEKPVKIYILAGQSIMNTMQSNLRLQQKK